VRTFFLTLLLHSFACLVAQQPLPAIGLWRDHLPYNSAIDLAKGNGKIYCATPYSLFSVATSDKSIERMSRITGLSETGISAIHYDNANEKLVIAYTNSNIDIVYRNDIVNVPDLKRDNVSGDKTIYNIYSSGNNYYFSTGLGVVVVDGERYEIKESWLIGAGGNQVKVNGVVNDNNFFYAATEEGLTKAPANVTNLADYNNWQLISGTNGLDTGSCQNVLILQNKVIAQKGDSLFVQDGINWVLFYQDDWPLISVTASENKISLCERKSSGESRVVVLNIDGTVINTFQQVSIIAYPRKAIIMEANTWIADQLSGLSQFNATSFEQYRPNSPGGVATGEIAVYNKVFYATAGGVDQLWNPQKNADGIYIFKEGAWTTINRSSYPSLDTLLDYVSIALDPKDETIWAGSYGGGLLHVKADHSFEIYKQNFLSPAIADPSSYRVSGLAFDQENNLWISNYGATKPLVVRKSDGALLKISIPFSLPGNALAQVLVDDTNYKWIVVAKGGGGLISFDHGTAIENTGDDRWKIFKAGAGNGNLPNDNVLCAAKDKNGFIWVGTANGIGVIQCPQEVFSGQGCEAVWPIVQEGNFAGYLFAGEEVNSIAVDGADRKWVATKNGVWLVNPTGEKVIYQFTEENSSLLSNDVKKIAIDGRTGEVYFATAKGICSFRSTATEGGEKNEALLVFPNPVPPGYSGTIGIRGLVANAIVKITELNGRLVYQARASGGQAVWDGRDYKGRKISSGVYLILVSNDERTEKAAGKIVFINK
jgi:ligand-binding sensor domain-containing protein